MWYKKKENINKMRVPDIDFNQLFFRVLKESNSMVFYLSLGERTRCNILSELSSKDLYRVYDLPYYISQRSYFNNDIDLGYYSDNIGPFCSGGVYDNFCNYWHQCLWALYSPYIRIILEKSFYDAGESCKFSHLAGSRLFYGYLSECEFMRDTFSINEINFHNVSSFIQWLGDYLRFTHDKDLNLFRAALCCIGLSCIMDYGYKFRREFIIFISNVQSNIEFNFMDSLTIDKWNYYIKDYD